MDKLVKVKVTKQDIKNGHKGDPGSCAISLAALRVFKDFQHASSRTMDFGKIHGNLLSVALPRSAARFIKTFDTCKKNAKPFTFQMRVPKELVK